MDTLRDKKVLEELWQSGKPPWRVWWWYQAYINKKDMRKITEDEISRYEKFEDQLNCI
jgi:hypothetical protein